MVSAAVDVVRKGAVSRFTRTLGTLIGSGVPILQGLEITARTAGNRVMVAWKSKFCRAGFPGFGLDDTAKEELATYLEIVMELMVYLGLIKRVLGGIVDIY